VFIRVHLRLLFVFAEPDTTNKDTISDEEKFSTAPVEIPVENAASDVTSF